MASLHCYHLGFEPNGTLPWLLFLYFFLLEIDSLSQHGVMLPPNMIGLTEEQIQELRLKDEFGDVCIPSGGYVVNTDPVGRRNGKGMINIILLMHQIFVATH